MSLPRGVLIQAETIGRDGEHHTYNEFVVTLQEKTIDVRLNDDDDTIVMCDVDEVKEAIKTLEGECVQCDAYRRLSRESDDD